MWFELKGDARLKRCDTDGCVGQPTWRLEADGRGANYCPGCKNRISLIEYGLEMGKMRKSLSEIIRTRLLGVKPEDQDIVLEDDDWRVILAALSRS